MLHLTVEQGICTGSSLVCHVCWALQYLAPWAGKHRRNQKTDQLGGYNVEQIKKSTGDTLLFMAPSSGDGHLG